MLNSIYSTASALQANEQAHANIAANLAHINVPGYRRSVNVFESMFNPDPNSPLPGQGVDVSGVRLAESANDFSTGPIKETGRSLDIALDGDGFLEIVGPEGPLYTRNGTLHIDTENGQLVSATGIPISGAGGPIQISGEIAPNQIQISADGKIRVAGEEIDQLKIVKFDDNSTLQRFGTTLFKAAENAPQSESDAKVRQGYLEMSNTYAVNELVQMMVGSRHFEASQRAMRTISEAIQQHTTPRR